MLDDSLCRLFVLSDKKDLIIKEISRWEKKNLHLVTYADVKYLTDLLKLPSYTIMENIETNFNIVLCFDTKIEKWKKELLILMLHKYSIITNTYYIKELD